MSSKADPDAQSPTSLTRYVRIRRTLNEKFIEFDFAIGDPCLYVELILPKEAFHIFCRQNNAVMMTQEQAELVDADMAKWRYGEPSPL